MNQKEVLLWRGLFALVLTVAIWLALPRYEWRTVNVAPGRQTLVRIDRWTGKAVAGLFGSGGAVGTWAPEEKP